MYQKDVTPLQDTKTNNFNEHPISENNFSQTFNNVTFTEPSIEHKAQRAKPNREFVDAAKTQQPSQDNPRAFLMLSTVKAIIKLKISKNYLHLKKIIL